MSRVVMVVYGDISHDTRVRREAQTLADVGHSVTIVCRPVDPRSTELTTSRIGDVDVLHVPLPDGWRRPWRILGAPLRSGARLLARIRGRPGGGETLTWLAMWRFANGGWTTHVTRVAPPADIVHAHDLPAGAAGLALAHRDGSPLVYDSHEVFLEARSSAERPRWARHWLVRREARVVAAAAAVVTVNDEVGAELIRRYPGPARRITVHNCAPRWTPPPSPSDRLRRAAAVPDGSPVALHHGSFVEHRGLVEMAEALTRPGLENVHGVYLGFGSLQARLDELAAEKRFGGRLHVVDAVDPGDVLDWVSGADVDVMAIAPSTLNHRLSTPNKLFESLAAGVPVVCSDFAPMRRIVLGDPLGPLGEVCDPLDPASIAAAIRAVLDRTPDERAALRARCLDAAHERWNWETESARLVGLYQGLGVAG
jgi:glycosyltransferase involved in cell wall biosynthesis